MLGLITPNHGPFCWPGQAKGEPTGSSPASAKKEITEHVAPKESSEKESSEARIDTAPPKGKPDSPPEGKNNTPEGKFDFFSDASWPMERIELTNGESRSGLIESVDDQWIYLVEIKRLTGRPGYVVVRPIERSTVVRMVRLPEEERQRLQERLASLAFHARIETLQMEAVALQKQVRNGIPIFFYSGRWFQLETTLPEEMTRRLIVRLDQVFSAYRQLLPPRTEPRRPLTVRIYSSRIAYEEALKRYEVRLVNPALFLPKENLVLAGTDLGQFAAQLDRLHQEHRRLQEEFSQLRTQLSQKLEELGRNLRQQGVPRQEAVKILQRERAALETQISQKLQEIQRVERKNGELFSKIMQQTLQQLYHEAFHAYMENYLFPTTEYPVPIWLQEGLAMLFQEGILEADTFRIDAPSPKAVEVIRNDLRKGNALSLVQILSAGPSEFLQTPGQITAMPNRYYAYAWALVYYLGRMERITPERMETYVSPAVQHLPPLERLERFVGMKAVQLQQDWHKFLQSL